MNSIAWHKQQHQLKHKAQQAAHNQPTEAQKKKKESPTLTLPHVAVHRLKQIN
jgi:hypothetical protein